MNCDNFGYLHLMIRQKILAYRIFKQTLEYQSFLIIQKTKTYLLYANLEQQIINYQQNADAGVIYKVKT
jgi:hypothetical protein